MATPSRDSYSSPELMGATEVAETVGVRVNNLDRVANLPAPIQTLAGGRIWLADEIREFAAERNARLAERKAKRKT